jgi:hypothetical protein
MDRQRDHDRALAALVRRQHGVIARRQLIALGIPEATIDLRVRAGRYLLLHRGVYAHGHSELRREGRWLAAVLASGPGAVLSHLHAAANWGLVADAAGWVHVSSPARSGMQRRRGIRLYKPHLPFDEVTEHDGIPTTTVSRTVLDVAASMEGRALEQVIRAAARRRRFDLVDQRAVVARHPRHPGAPALATLLARLEGRGTDDMRSKLEVFFGQLCDDHGLPRPVVNGRADGVRVDFHWPDTRLAIETDGFDFHSMPTVFEDDRARDQRLILAGWTVVRFTYDQVALRPGEVAQTVVTLLSRSWGACRW